MTAATMTRNNERFMPWWLVLIEGILAVVLGVFLLARPAATTLFVVQVLGWYWLISGVLSIVMIFVDRTMWGWKLFMGIIGIIAGFWIVNNPIQGAVASIWAIILVLAFQGIIFGIIGLIAAFQGGGWGSGILGVISIVFGIILLGHSWSAALVLPWVIGIFLIGGGIFAIIASFRMRR